MPDLQQTVDGIVSALPGAQSAEDVIAFLKKASELMAIMPGAPEGGAMPSPDQMGEMEMEMKKQAAYSRIATDLAAELSVEPDKLIPTVKAMSMTKKDGDQTAGRIAALESELKERKIADLIAANSNRIPPAERENVKAFATKYGLDAASEMVAKLPELPGGGAGKKVVDNSRETLDDERLAIARKQGIDPETIKKFSRNINKEA